MIHEIVAPCLEITGEQAGEKINYMIKYRKLQKYRQNGNDQKTLLREPESMENSKGQKTKRKKKKTVEKKQAKYRSMKSLGYQDMFGFMQPQPGHLISVEN